MIPEAAGVCFSDHRLVSAYEDLRSQALHGKQAGVGLALIMARGLRCWMEACSPLLHTECNTRPASQCPEFRLPSGVRGEVVVLIASMLLHKTAKRIK